MAMNGQSDRRPLTVSVLPLTNTCHRVAADVADRFALPLGDRDADAHLLVGPEGLALRINRGELAAGRPITCDWSRRNVTSPMGARLTQPLLKAVGIRKGDPWRPAVIDATAGLGEDAYLLAAMGCRVTAIERSAPLAAMLEAAVESSGHRTRGSLSAALAADPRSPTPVPALSITVVHGDSITELAHRSADVVYLDPMFPPGRRTMERKPMRVLRLLVGKDADVAALFTAALRAARRRVVVKRPRHAPAWNDLPPKVSHHGQAVRYDVYIPAELGHRPEGLPDD